MLHLLLQLAHTALLQAEHELATATIEPHLAHARLPSASSAMFRVSNEMMSDVVSFGLGEGVAADTIVSRGLSHNPLLLKDGWRRAPGWLSSAF